ncbi:MAG TPA: hypothetical protein VIV40_11350 [Kofleriaceae bacterium]
MKNLDHTAARLLATALLFAACGGKSAPATKPGPADVAPPADMAFKDMNADQRMAFMKLTVLPAMKQTFQEFDAKKFADMNCETCHGKAAKDGTFEMPNPDIERLPKPEQFMAYAADPKHAPWVKFMAEKVKPQMAQLLKMSEFDPKTETGDFSCGNCHMVIGEEKKK